MSFLLFTYFHFEFLTRQGPMLLDNPKHHMNFFLLASAEKTRQKMGVNVRNSNTTLTLPGGYIFHIPLVKVPTDLEGRIF